MAARDAGCSNNHRVYSATTLTVALGTRLSNHNVFENKRFLRFFFTNGPVTFINLRAVSWEVKLNTLNKIGKIFRENAFDEKKKRPGLKFNPGVALTGLRTTRPRSLSVNGFKVFNCCMIYSWTLNFIGPFAKKPENLLSSKNVVIEQDWIIFHQVPRFE